MLVKIDAAQLEWRVAVWLSNDQVGINEINNKEDIHAINQVAFGLPTRLIAKTYLFRTIFRGSGYSFSCDPNFSHVSGKPAFWDDVNSKFYHKYAGLDQWHNSLARLVALRRAIVSPLGRIWNIAPLPDGNIPWTIFTNYPVQGTGADLMAVARVSLWNRLRKLYGPTPRAKLVSTVHDDLKLDVPAEEVDQVISTAMSVFQDLPKNVKKLFGIDLPIPFPGEAYVGKDLLNMEKVA